MCLRRQTRWEMLTEKQKQNPRCSKLRDGSQRETEQSRSPLTRGRRGPAVRWVAGPAAGPSVRPRSPGSPTGDTSSRLCPSPEPPAPHLLPPRCPEPARILPARLPAAHPQPERENPTPGRTCQRALAAAANQVSGAGTPWSSFPARPSNGPIGALFYNAFPLRKLRLVSQARRWGRPGSPDVGVRNGAHPPSLSRPRTALGPPPRTEARTRATSAILSFLEATLSKSKETGKLLRSILFNPIHPEYCLNIQNQCKSGDILYSVLFFVLSLQCPVCDLLHGTAIRTGANSNTRKPRAADGTQCPREAAHRRRRAAGLRCRLLVPRAERSRAS